MRFADWLDEWLDAREQRGDIKRTTLDNYRRYVDADIKPSALGRLRLTQIKRPDVRRFVDGLIGERLVVQIDGFAHHSTSAQRSADIAHDAELRLRGYTVLRFSYRQVVHESVLVERTIRRAIAQRLHLAR